MNFSKSLDLNTSTLSKGPQYIQRLKRDLDDLQNYDFSCSASNLKIEIHENSFYMNICIREGPYRNGHYLFVVLIPEKYPFRIPEVFSVRPIWHPNVEPLAGRVGLPIEWSPVLTLVSFALAIQLILLEPCGEIILNPEAYKLYIHETIKFELKIQQTISFHRNYCDASFCMNLDSSFSSSCQIKCPKIDEIEHKNMKVDHQKSYDNQYGLTSMILKRKHSSSQLLSNNMKSMVTDTIYVDYPRKRSADMMTDDIDNHSCNMIYYNEQHSTSPIQIRHENKRYSFDDSIVNSNEVRDDDVMDEYPSRYRSYQEDMSYSPFHSIDAPSNDHINYDFWQSKKKFRPVYPLEEETTWS